MSGNMFNKFKSAVSNVMGGISGLPMVAGEDRDTGPRSPGASSDGSDPGPVVQVKYKYARPAFLQLNDDEVQVSADNAIRPIIVPRDVSKLPWNAGYAEVINAGKTKLNEDQARAGTMFVPREGEDVPMSPTPSDEWDEEVLEEKFDFVEVGQGPHATNTTTTQKAKPRAMSEVSSEIDMMTDRKKPSWTGGILPSNDPIPFTYFALFDGHAGSGAAVMAVNCLHKHIQVQLGMMRDLLVAKRYNLDPMYLMAGSSHIGLRDRSSTVSLDDLVTGALEKAFKEMDDQISQERLIYKITGGCTAIVALFFMGKLYVANAGDCRAVMCRGDDVFAMSSDFTPESERARVQLVGSLRPELLHREFSHLEFPRRVTQRDIGKKMLYKDAAMKGWAYKVIMEEDTKFPLVHGEGKKARLLATIGVTRGFGDHDLRVYESDIYVKPFMSCIPEVQVYDMSSYYHSENDVLIMGSDGLWDVTSNDKAARIVRECLEQFDSDDRSRYTSAAQELVMQARGLPKKGWRTLDNKMASGDDITAFVIPLHRYMCTMSESSSTESSVETS